MPKFYLLLFLLPYLSRAQDSTATNNTILSVGAKKQDSTRIRQSARSANLLRKDVWRIDFLGPGYLNEHRLGKRTTLTSQFRLVGAFRIEDRFEGYGYTYTVKKAIEFSINPEVSVAVRRFYNLVKRKEAGKSIRYNSGGYFAAKAGYIFSPLFKNVNIDIQGAGFNVLWGVQHTAPRHFYVNLELGVGVAQYYKNTISPTGSFVLGHTF